MNFSKSIKYRRFTFIILVTIIYSSLLIAGLNIMIDPYGITSSPAIAGLNRVKPEKLEHARLFKAVDIIRIKPKTIFLGTSTTDFGLDPNHPALAKVQPAYNIGLSSVNMYELMRYFEHALYNQPDLKQVIIGIDTFTFDKFRPNTVDYDERRLETNTLYYQDIWNVTFSMNAFISSVKTIVANLSHLDLQPYAANGTRNENWHTTNKPAIYTFIKSLENDLQEIITLSDKRFNNFKKIMEICHQRNVDVKVFMPPLHATVIAGYYLNNKIRVIEQTKRNLVKMTPVWDFSGFNSITTETVSNNMKNYIDAFHYRKNVGNLVLNRMLHFHEKTVPADFGFLMTPENIETHFAEIREQQMEWQKNNPELVKLLRDIEQMKEL